MAVEFIALPVKHLLIVGGRETFIESYFDGLPNSPTSFFLFCPVKNKLFSLECTEKYAGNALNLKPFLFRKFGFRFGQDVEDGLLFLARPSRIVSFSSKDKSSANFTNA